MLDNFGSEMKPIVPFILSVFNFYYMPKYVILSKYKVLWYI